LDLCLPQPLRPSHPGQPGHWQAWGDPLEPLPLPADGLGHRVPLHPQGSEVLGQGEAKGGQVRSGWPQRPEGRPGGRRQALTEAEKTDFTCQGEGHCLRKGEEGQGLGCFLD
jgi:hypothetical protein